MEDKENSAEEIIIHEQYTRMGNTVTVCLLILDTGREIVGYHSSVVPERYDFANGKKEAKVEAVRRANEYITSIITFNEAIRKSREAKEKEDSLTERPMTPEEVFQKDSNEKE